MSTAPTGWQTPKVNWQPADVVQASDLNRVEGNVNAIETGSRTIDPAQAPTGNVGTLRQLLDWFANRIREIIGKTNWYDAPDFTLAQAASHSGQTAQAHGHHESQDVVINRSGSKVASIVVLKPTLSGVKRIEAVLTYDAAGKLSSVDEKVYASDGLTVQSRAITTFVRDVATGQILRAEVRPA